MNELGFNFDFDIGDFSGLEISLESDFNSRYIKPPKTKIIEDCQLKYSNAEKLAEKLEGEIRHQQGSALQS